MRLFRPDMAAPPRMLANEQPNQQAPQRVQPQRGPGLRPGMSGQARPGSAPMRSLSLTPEQMSQQHVFYDTMRQPGTPPPFVQGGTDERSSSLMRSLTPEQLSQQHVMAGPMMRPGTPPPMMEGMNSGDPFRFVTPMRPGAKVPTPEDMERVRQEIMASRGQPNPQPGTPPPPMMGDMAQSGMARNIDAMAQSGMAQSQMAQPQMAQPSMAQARPAMGMAQPPTSAPVRAPARTPVRVPVAPPRRDRPVPSAPIPAAGTRMKKGGAVAAKSVKAAAKTSRPAKSSKPAVAKTSNYARGGGCEVRGKTKGKMR
jgi:hypothetical protein